MFQLPNSKYREEQQTGCRQQGCRRAEKPTTTSFLGSTTHPGPFFLPPHSHSHPLLAPRKYFSLTLFESYQWQAGRRARGGGGADGTVACCGCLRDLGERARSRGHGCSLLQALRLLVASPLQIADARYAAYRTLPPPLPLPRILRVFVSLSSSHSRRAPRLILLLLGAAASARHLGCFFCCGFSGVSAVRFRVRDFALPFGGMRPRRSRSNCGSDPIRSICSHAQERSESWFAPAGGRHLLR